MRLKLDGRLRGRVGAERDHADGAIRRRACQQQAKVVRGPRDAIDAELVRGVPIRLHPVVELHLLPHNDGAVVRGRRQHRLELGVRPLHLPHRALVRLELCHQRVAIASHVEHAHASVTGPSREPAPVKVQLGIVLAAGERCETLQGPGRGAKAETRKKKEAGAVAPRASHGLQQRNVAVHVLHALRCGGERENPVHTYDGVQVARVDVGIGSHGTKRSTRGGSGENESPLTSNKA